jgi:uncharacterized repeat protein (TIGR01451 family)
MRSRVVWWSGVALAALCAVRPSPAVAQNEDSGAKALVITATNLMDADAKRPLANANANANANARDRDAVMPGDIIRYQLRFTNTTRRAVREVVFTDPVPAGLHFVATPTAPDRDDVAVTYSIDGGRSYSMRPVIETVVDGKRVVRPAPPASYTHVRWTVLGWVQPAAHVTVEFRAQLAPGKEAP